MLRTKEAKNKLAYKSISRAQVVLVKLSSDGRSHPE